MTLIDSELTGNNRNDAVGCAILALDSISECPRRSSAASVPPHCHLRCRPCPSQECPRHSFHHVASVTLGLPGSHRLSCEDAYSPPACVGLGAQPCPVPLTSCPGLQPPIGLRWVDPLKAPLVAEVTPVRKGERWKLSFQVFAHELCAGRSLIHMSSHLCE